MSTTDKTARLTVKKDTTTGEYVVRGIDPRDGSTVEAWEADRDSAVETARDILTRWGSTVVRADGRHGYIGDLPSDEALSACPASGDASPCIDGNPEDASLCHRCGGEVPTEACPAIPTVPCSADEAEDGRAPSLFGDLGSVSEADAIGPPRPISDRASQDSQEARQEDPASTLVRGIGDAARSVEALSGRLVGRFPGRSPSAVGEAGSVRALRQTIREADAIREAAREALSLARLRTGARLLETLGPKYRSDLLRALDLLRDAARMQSDEAPGGEQTATAEALAEALPLLSRWAHGYAIDRIGHHGIDGREDPQEAARVSIGAVRDDSGTILRALGRGVLSGASADVRRFCIGARTLVEDAALSADRISDAVDMGTED